MDHPDPAASHIVRTARALIGTTPAQLAAHMGAVPERPLKVGPDCPVRSFDDLEHVLRALTGWYEGVLDPGADSARNRPRTGSDLDETVRRYLALRSEWELRESAIVAGSLAKAAAQRPAPDGATSAVAAVPLDSGAVRRRALLVDDSADILVTIGSFLTAFGFDVISASSGDAALRMLLESAPIDLLVTDHAMPGMTGRDLAVEACRSHQALRALIITGYPNLSELTQLPERVLLLAKPFRRAELSARLRLLFRASGEASELPVVAERA